MTSLMDYETHLQKQNWMLHNRNISQHVTCIHWLNNLRFWIEISVEINFAGFETYVFAQHFADVGISLALDLKKSNVVLYVALFRENTKSLLSNTIINNRCIFRMDVWSGELVYVGCNC